MKILIINYRYFLSGGPEKYMFSIKALLEKYGHEVIPFSVKSARNVKTNYEGYFAEPIGGEKVYFEEYGRDIKTMLQMLDRQFYSMDVKKKLEKLIRATRPDVCYLLHHYNKLSPSVIAACRKYHVPVIMRVSDFFLACPNGLFVKNGKICEECAHGSLFNAVKGRCIKNSAVASTVKVIAMYFHRLAKIYKDVSYIIAPSKFTISKLNFLPNRFVHIPTFIEVKKQPDFKTGSYALFVGRLEEEKGIMTAIKAVQGTGYKLKIVGKSSTGYEHEVKDFVRKNNINNVKFLGARYGRNLAGLYRNSRFVIIPAQWYENMPNVALEAMSHGKPIVASRLGSLKKLVRDGHNGFLFEPKNIEKLRGTMHKLFASDKLCRELGRNAHNDAITKYAPEKHYKKLLHVFNLAIKEERWKG